MTLRPNGGGASCVWQVRYVERVAVPLPLDGTFLSSTCGAGIACTMRDASVQYMDSLYRSTCYQKKRAAKLQTAKARSIAKPAGKAWNLRLYIAGQTTKSISAIANLKRICEHHIPAHCNIEVIDLMQSPHLARYDQIVAIPTLIRSIPGPIKRVFGDLSATERVLFDLDLRV